MFQCPPSHRQPPSREQLFCFLLSPVEIVDSSMRLNPFMFDVAGIAKDIDIRLGLRNSRRKGEIGRISKCTGIENCDIRREWTVASINCSCYLANDCRDLALVHLPRLNLIETRRCNEDLSTWPVDANGVVPCCE